MTKPSRKYVKFEQIFPLSILMIEFKEVDCGIHEYAISNASSHDGLKKLEAQGMGNMQEPFNGQKRAEPEL